MKKTYALLFILSLFFHITFSKISFDGIYSKIFSKPVNKTVHKKLTVEENTSLSIENIYGNIDIKTEWKQNSIILKATKQVPKKENPQDIAIKIIRDKNKKNMLIKTVHKNNTSKNYKYSVDYELIIPSSLTVKLATKQGNIKIKRTKGSITAHTNKGEIKISENNGAITANSHNGNIIISQSNGDIQAIAKNGNITIDGSLKSVNAETEYGYIKSICKDIPSIGSINLSTKSGNISLALPKTTNADIKASTKKGRLTSEHLITVKPQTVTLDKKTWQRFKREVDGTLGSGEAIIKLSSNHGNIKILKSTT